MRRFAFWITAVLFFLAPFHAFFITWFRNAAEPSAGFDILISAWREFFLVILFLIALPNIRIEVLKKNIWILIFALLPLLFLIFQANNPPQWLWGARFDVPLFVSFLIFLFLEFSERQKEILMKIFFGVGFVVVLFGFTHAVFLPQNSLVPFGYSVDRDIWDVSTAISSCQPLEHTREFCRAVSTFGGPTRYGTYLLLLLSLGAFRLISAREKKQKYFFSFLVLLALANIFLTFSRSIWISLFVMIVLALFFIGRERTPPLPWKKIIAIVSGIFLIFILFTYNSFKLIFLRASSSSEHLELFKTGFQKFLEKPWFGHGLGAAGPASLRGVSPLITENWFLQIGIEMGLIGLLLFLLALWQLGKKSSFPILMALIGISVAGLFTHSFEETTTVILLGALICIVEIKNPIDKTVNFDKIASTWETRH